jgi:hypothetical protein
MDVDYNPTSLQLAEIGASDSMAGWSSAEAELQSAARRFQQTLVDQQIQQQEDASDIAKRFKLASERLASQQQLAAAQLAEVQAEQKQVSHGWQHGAIPQAYDRMQSAPISPHLQGTGSYPGRIFATQGAGTGRAESAKKKSLALPQTVTEVWRQRNPALAALLLQPVLYGYSLIVWILAGIFTGAFPLFCFHLGKRVSGAQARNSNAGRLPISQDDRATRSSPGRLSSFFVYPGSSLNQRDAQMRPQPQAAEPEGVESWVKVPVHYNKKQASGYLDDESDGEAGRCNVASSSHHQSHGYVDEY